MGIILEAVNDKKRLSKPQHQIFIVVGFIVLILHTGAILARLNDPNIHIFDVISFIYILFDVSQKNVSNKDKDKDKDKENATNKVVDDKTKHNKKTQRKTSAHRGGTESSRSISISSPELIRRFQSSAKVKKMILLSKVLKECINKLLPISRELELFYNCDNETLNKITTLITVYLSDLKKRYKSLLEAIENNDTTFANVMSSDVGNVQFIKNNLSNKIFTNPPSNVFMNILSRQISGKRINICKSEFELNKVINNKDIETLERIVKNNKKW